MEVCMPISRRDFMKIATASALSLILNETDLFNTMQSAAAQAPTGKLPVIWLNGSGCSGCSISLMNAANPTIDQVLLNNIELGYHPTLTAAAGDLAYQVARKIVLAGGFALVIEGGIPTGSAGKFCYVCSIGDWHVTMAEAVTILAPYAKQIIAVGSCAAYGGFSAANSLTGTKGAGDFLGKAVINLPGCPAHPDWIIGSLVQLIGGTVPALDSKGRPKAYYPEKMCKHCPNEDRDEARFLGQPGCMEEIGCKGENTFGDCSIRKWNNGQSWCIAVNSPCIGCTEPSFPSFPLRGGGDGNEDDDDGHRD